MRLHLCCKYILFTMLKTDGQLKNSKYAEHITQWDHTFLRLLVDQGCHIVKISYILKAPSF